MSNSYEILNKAASTLLLYPKREFSYLGATFTYYLVNGDPNGLEDKYDTYVDANIAKLVAQFRTNFNIKNKFKERTEKDFDPVWFATYVRSNKQLRTIVKQHAVAYFASLFIDAITSRINDDDAVNSMLTKLLTVSDNNIDNNSIKSFSYAAYITLLDYLTNDIIENNKILLRKIKNKTVEMDELVSTLFLQCYVLAHHFGLISSIEQRVYDLINTLDKEMIIHILDNSTTQTLQDISYIRTTNVDNYSPQIVPGSVALTMPGTRPLAVNDLGLDFINQYSEFITYNKDDNTVRFHNIFAIFNKLVFDTIMVRIVSTIEALGDKNSSNADSRVLEVLDNSNTSIRGRKKYAAVKLKDLDLTDEQRHEYIYNHLVGKYMYLTFKLFPLKSVTTIAPDPNVYDMYDITNIYNNAAVNNNNYGYVKISDYYYLLPFSSLTQGRQAYAALLYLERRARAIGEAIDTMLFVQTENAKRLELVSCKVSNKQLTTTAKSNTIIIAVKVPNNEKDLAAYIQRELNNNGVLLSSFSLQIDTDNIEYPLLKIESSLLPPVEVIAFTTYALDSIETIKENIALYKSITVRKTQLQTEHYEKFSVNAEQNISSATIFDMS